MALSNSITELVSDLLRLCHARVFKYKPTDVHLPLKDMDMEIFRPVWYLKGYGTSRRRFSKCKAACLSYTAPLLSANVRSCWKESNSSSAMLQPAQTVTQQC